jgi:AmiR/NasT family two-component response regulator
MTRLELLLLQRAKARLMNAYGLTEEQAHKFIVTTAMHTRRTKVAVARDLVTLESIK